MKRQIAAIALSIACALCMVGRAFAYNAVWVESKTVAPGATGVTVNVWVVNDTPLSGFVLPLEFRDTDGNGSYIAGSCAFNIPAGNRIGASPLAETVTKLVMGTPTDTVCFRYHYPDGWVVHPLCCGPVGHSYIALNRPVNFVSPDGFYWSGISTGGPPDLWYLPPGSDSVGGVHRGWPTDGDSSVYSAGPSFTFVFNVNMIPGTFEIDTMCVCLANHLQGTESDSAHSVAFEFHKGAITISADPNVPPIVVVVMLASVAEGDSLGITVAASDPNGTNPSLAAANLPPNATFIDGGGGMGLLSFRPDFTQAGTYQVLIFATDGELADSALVTITVTNTNRVPVLAAIGPKSVNEGQNLTFGVSASDPDATPLTLTAQNVPLHATFTDNGNGTGSFVFNPDFTQSGTHNVRFIASDGALADSETVVVTVNDVSAVRSLETGGGVPTTYILEPNYPNPFNAGTVVRFSTPHDGRVRLDVFNILGRRVRTLLDDFKPLGTYAVDWDGTDDRGRPVASGIYFYRFIADDWSKTRSMMLLR